MENKDYISTALDFFKTRITRISVEFRDDFKKALDVAYEKWFELLSLFPTFYYRKTSKNLKTLYKLDLIVIGVITLFVFAIYMYYAILSQNPEYNFFVMIYSTGYYFLMICLIIIFLCLLNLPMVVGHFRMNTKSLMRFTFKITFKKIFSTALYLLIVGLPILVVLFMNVLIPIWLLLGFSLPLYFMYYIARKDYWKYLKDINEIYKDEEN